MSKSARGFTLIELLVVITIISILGTIGLTIYSTTVRNTRDAKRKADLDAISKALGQYKVQNGSYPPSVQSFSSHVTGCVCGTDWTTLGTALANYTQSMPADPLNIDLQYCGHPGQADQVGCHIYAYCQTDGGNSFVLGANLENPVTPTQVSDPSCPMAGNNLYYIRNQL